MPELDMKVTFFLGGKEVGVADISPLTTIHVHVS